MSWQFAGCTAARFCCRRRGEISQRHVVGSVLILRPDKRPDAGDSHAGKQHSERDADITEAAARSFSRRNAPLGGEEPDAVGKVPADGDHRNHVDGKDPRIRKLVLHFGECHAGILRQAHAHEALRRNVVCDIRKCDQAGVALRQVHPVPCPRVVHNVRFAAQPDVDAIDRVIQNRQKDKNPLQHAHQRQAVEKLHLLAVGDRPLQRFEVREQVLEEKRADGNDAEQRMQLAPDKTRALPRAQRLNAAADNMRRGRMRRRSAAG